MNRDGGMGLSDGMTEKCLLAHEEELRFEDADQRIPESHSHTALGPQVPVSWLTSLSTYSCLTDKRLTLATNLGSLLIHKTIVDSSLPIQTCSTCGTSPMARFAAVDSV